MIILAYCFIKCCVTVSKSFVGLVGEGHVNETRHGRKGNNMEDLKGRLEHMRAIESTGFGMWHDQKRVV